METNNQKNDQNIIPNDADKQQKGVNVPNLRFNEFDVCWTTYKLEACAKIYDGTHQTPKYTKSGIRFISVENILNLYDSQKFISLEDFKKEFKIHPQINDILMTRIGDIGTPAVVSKEDLLAYYVSLALIRPLKNLYYLYIYDYIQTPYFKKELWHRTLHIAFPQKINKEEIGKCKISIPCEKEQFKIGNFLLLIDHRIDTQSKIIEDLELFKKGIENQYFSYHKNNEYVILGDIITQVNNRNEQNKDFEVLSVSNKYGFIPQSEQFDDHEVASANKSNYKIVKQNDFAYNPARINVGSIAMLRNNQVGIVSPMYICFRADNNRILSSYLDYFSHSNKFNNEVLKNLEGSVRLCLSFESLSKIKIHLPSLDTQYKIVKNLDLISSKISIENKILEKLKEQKKYLLSNMFI